MIPQQNMHISRQMPQMPPTQIVYAHRSTQPGSPPAESQTRTRPSSPAEQLSPKRRLANDLVEKF